MLMSQLEQVQANFSIKEVELKHLALQLELMTNQNEACVQQLKDEIVSLEVKTIIFILLPTFFLILISSFLNHYVCFPFNFYIFVFACRKMSPPSRYCRRRERRRRRSKRASLLHSSRRRTWR